MTIPFYKYQGTGNDFIIIDNRSGQYGALTTRQVNFLCQRRTGIGADGLMLLNPHADYDFRMIYYNADGKEGSMCGNGGRCLVKFASDIGITKSDYTFLAVDGVHEASVELDGTISLRMQDLNGIDANIDTFVLNTGSPHVVKLIPDVRHMDVVANGREIRNSPSYQKEGINVNFVQQTEEPDKIIVRTYERGVEDETLSCGTGVTAAALVCCHNDVGFNRVEVQTKGGPLSVEFTKTGDSYTNIWLNGPAVKVFEGSIVLED